LLLDEFLVGSLALFIVVLDFPLDFGSTSDNLYLFVAFVAKFSVFINLIYGSYLDNHCYISQVSYLILYFDLKLYSIY